MSERTVEEIRREIADERARLDGDLSALKSEVRSFALFAVVGLAAVALVTWRMGKRKGAATLWKFAR